MQRAATWSDRIRTQPRRVRRRGIVLESFVAYPIVAVGYYLLVATGRVPSLVWAPIALVLMTGFVLGLFVIYGFARNRADPNDPSLDERQCDLAVRAWALSYGVVTWVVVAIAAVWALFVTSVGPMVVGPEFLLPVAIGAGVYLPTLPLAVLAWIEPDAPADEDRPLR
jgi:hypothetical protein